MPDRADQIKIDVTLAGYIYFLCRAERTASLRTQRPEAFLRKDTADYLYAIARLVSSLIKIPISIEKDMNEEPP